MELIEWRRMLMAQTILTDPYGGIIPVYLDNHYLDVSSGTLSEGLVYDPDYFIAGPFNLNASYCILYYSPIFSKNSSHIYMRTYWYTDDPEATARQNEVIDSNTISSDEGSTSINGTYLYFSVYKPNAANTYCIKYPNTVIFKGSNVT